jgi:hypothetical protein
VSSHIQTAIWLLCMFPRLPFGCCACFQSHGHGIIHMFVGLFTWSWNQSISEVGLRVATMPIYMIYGCWVI